MAKNSRGGRASRPLQLRKRLSEDEYWERLLHSVDREWARGAYGSSDQEPSERVIDTRMKWEDEEDDGQTRE